MQDKESKEFRSLTHSQREGLADLPEDLQPGILTKRFRNHVWSILETSMNDYALMRMGSFNSIDWQRYVDYWENFFTTYYLTILEIPHDAIEMRSREELKKWLRTLILEKSYHEVITVLEYMLRIQSIPKKLANGIEKCFGELSTYLVDRTSEPVCVIPTTSKEMKDITNNSLDNINKSPLVKARTCLHKAAEQLNNKDFPASVRESIRAVESATLQMHSKSSGKFDDAVNYLEKHGLLKHPTWKVILTKLYAYAGDRKDVRHPSSKPKAADVDFNEAICVYGVCVSIVDYLARQSDLLKDK